jgi:hypothetical protein
MIEPTLAAAAFGDQPGRWPLPAATTPNQLWWRAVAAGGQGRYGSAYRDLAVLRRGATSGRLVTPLVSLAHSTQGSFLRQLGWHSRARGWDGCALALAGADPEARADALIGLAADALGVGRFAAASALLSRADSALAACPIKGAVPERIPVRRRWVAAELAMACGDGALAVRHAEDAVELAKAMSLTTGQASARHQVKSEVVLAAALCSAGATERARTVAEAALDATGRSGLVPLRWAVACLLIDIRSVTFSAQKLGEIRDVCAGQVRRAGGTRPSA